MVGGTLAVVGVEASVCSTAGVVGVTVGIVVMGAAESSVVGGIAAVVTVVSSTVVLSEETAVAVL